MPNYKGTRCGLGIIRKCARCVMLYEPMMNKQRFCNMHRSVKKIRIPKEKVIKDHKWFYKIDNKYFYLHVSELEASVSFRQN